MRPNAFEQEQDQLPRRPTHRQREPRVGVDWIMETVREPHGLLARLV